IPHPPAAPQRAPPSPARGEGSMQRSFAPPLPLRERVGVSGLRQGETMSAKRAKAPTAAITVTPTAGGVGAEIGGVDLRSAGDAQFAAIRDAWVAHSVLLFRGQRLSDDELIAFSRRFGDLDWAPVQETGRRFVEGKPELYVVSNVVENGVPIGSLGAGEAVWHTDMSYLADPPKASMLYALEIPPAGGKTWFLNMYRGYDALPAGLKRRIEGLKLKHDG